MVKLIAFIFGTVMHPCWGYQQGRNYPYIDNILKVTNFFKNSHFTHFGIHAKDTNFTFGTPYTHMYTDTHRHMHIYRHRCRYHFHILYFLAHLAYIPQT